jgi:hypothetical protein
MGRDLITESDPDDSSCRPAAAVPFTVSALERTILPDLISAIRAAPAVSLAPAKDSRNIAQRTQGLEGFGGGGGSSSAADSKRRLTFVSNRRAHPDSRDGLIDTPEPISSVLLPDLWETLPDLYQLPAAARASFGRACAQSAGPGGSSDGGGDKLVVAIIISGPNSMVQVPVVTGSPNPCPSPSLSEPQTDLALHAAARPPENSPPPQSDAAPALVEAVREVPDLDPSALRASLACDHAPSTCAATPAASVHSADPSLVEMVFESPIVDELCGSRLPNKDLQASCRESDPAESA